MKKNKKLEQPEVLHKHMALAHEEYVEDLIVIPPDGGWGWVIVIMSFLSFFIIDGIIYTFGVYLDDISETFQVHPTSIAHVTSLMSGFYFIVGPITCSLINRYGFRFVGITGGIIASAAFVSSTFISNLYLFLVIMGVVCGIGFNMIYLSSFLIVGFYFEKWRALATAIAVCGSAVGVIAFPPVLTAILGDLPWRWKFRVMSGLNMICSLCALSYIPVKPTKIHERRPTIESIKEIPGSSSNGKAAHTSDRRGSIKEYHNHMFPTTSKLHEAANGHVITHDQKSSERNSGKKLISETPVNLATVYEFEDDEEDESRCRRICCDCCCRSNCKKKITHSPTAHSKKISRPMYRDDILYNGSLSLLPEYSPEPGPDRRKCSISYHLCVTRVATQRDVEENKRCVCCPEAVVRTIVTMLSLELMKSPTFIVLTFSGFFTISGMYCPFIFISERAMEMHISQDWATLLLTLIGVANLTGRIACGILSWFPKVDVVIVSSVTLIFAGGATIFSCYMHALEGQIIFAVLFGFNLGPITCAITNRYGFRFVGITGGIIASAAFVSSSFISNLYVFLVIMGVICGIGFNMIFLSSFLIVGFYFEKWRALATAIAVCGSAVGVIAFPPVLTAILGDLHWRWKFRVMSGLNIICSLCALAYIPIKPTKIHERRPTIDSIKETPGSSSNGKDAHTSGRRGSIKEYHNHMFPTTSKLHEATKGHVITPDQKSSERNTGKKLISDKPVNLATVYEIEDDEEVESCCRRICCDCCGRSNCKKKSKDSPTAHSRKISRPMYRDDILYNGSLSMLPQYSPEPGPNRRQSSINYHLTVTRVATQRDVEENRRCVCCPEAVLRTIVTMLSLELMKSPTFLLLTFSGFFTISGMYCPFIFITERAMEMHISNDWATLLLTIIGVANLTGRIACGILSWFPKIDVVIVSSITLIFAGGATIFSCYMHALEGQIIFAVLFGFNLASLTVLRSIVIVDLLGLENLTNGFGITSMFYGFGAFIGLPLCGFLRNHTGGYDASFLLSGALISFSGVLIIPLRQISKWEKKKQMISNKP